MNFPQPGQYIDTNLGPVLIEKLLGQGKSGYSYRGQAGTRAVIFKQMHDEPCTYYHFGNNKVRLEVNAYRVLQPTGIRLPRLLEFDDERLYLIKEYIAGPTAADWLISGGDAAQIIGQLFEMAELVQRHNLNIDYFPTNFVISKKSLYYIDYEMNPYDPQWNLENWGLYYWANPAGLKHYFETGDPLAINVSADSGVPIKAPFAEMVQGWIHLEKLNSDHI